RESILTSERVNSLSIEAELFYRRLMSVADDWGRFHANLTLLRTQVYPLKPDLYTETQIEGFLSECERAGLLALYVANGRRYLDIVNFGQRTQSKSSKFPSPDDGSQRLTVIHREKAEQRAVNGDTPQSTVIHRDPPLSTVESGGSPEKSASYGYAYGYG